MFRNQLMFLLLIGIILCAPLTSATQYARLELSGAVTDTEGNSLAGVQVVAVDEDRGNERSAVTSSDGRFTISGLAAGSYTVTFELDGYESHHEVAVQVRAGSGLLDVTLQTPEESDC